MTEDKNFKEILDKAKELESINFKESKDFNFTEYYGVIEKISKKNTTIKNEEAENLIKEYSEKVIDKDFINELISKKESILDFIRKYDPNSDIIKEMSLSDVDKVYAISNYLVNSYINYLNDMKFNFELSKGELKFLDNILTRSIEYNGDDVFTYVELYDNFWYGVRKTYDDNKSSETFTFKVSIKMILILHHLIKNYKVRGVTDEFKHFRNILYKIAQTNKLFNAYNIVVDRIKDDCKLWGNALDEVLTPREENVQQIKEIKQETQD